MKLIWAKAILLFRYQPAHFTLIKQPLNVLTIFIWFYTVTGKLNLFCIEVGWWSQMARLIFITGLCEYVWVNIHTLSSLTVIWSKRISKFLFSFLFEKSVLFCLLPHSHWLSTLPAAVCQYMCTLVELVCMSFPKLTICIYSQSVVIRTISVIYPPRSNLDKQSMICRIQTDIWCILSTEDKSIEFVKAIYQSVSLMLFHNTWSQWWH